MAEVIEIFSDGSLQCTIGSAESDRGLWGTYTLRESGEFAMEMSRLGEPTRTIHVHGQVRFDQGRITIRGRLTDDRAGTASNITYLLEPTQ